MEIEQSWAVFDSLRVPEEPEFVKLIDPNYHCSVCGGEKSFGGLDDLPVCIQCGIVDTEYISEEPEWISGPGGEGPDPSRVGAPVNTEHFSEGWTMGTRIGNSRKQNFRLAILHRNSMYNHKDRSLYHAYEELDRVGAGLLNLPPVVMYAAKSMYKKFNENVLTRGAVRSGVKANCVFQACREHGIARTTHEIAEAFGIPSRDLARTTEIFQEQVPEDGVHVIQPADLIPRFFNEIKGLPDEQKNRLKMQTIKACKAVQDCVELMGRTPRAVACAVMRVVFDKAGVGPSKAELCRICDVSVPTLGKIENIVKESGLI